MRRASRSAERRGQSMVELALILPIFLLLALGVVDMGRLIYANTAVGNAAREGMRAAIVNQNLADIRTVASRQGTALGLPTSDPGGCPTLVGATTAQLGTCVVFDDPPNLSTNCASPYVGCVAVVTVKYTFQAITPIIGNLLGAIPVVSISKQPIESVCSGPGCPTP